VRHRFQRDFRPVGSASHFDNFDRVESSLTICRRPVDVLAVLSRLALEQSVRKSGPDFSPLENAPAANFSCRFEHAGHRRPGGVAGRRPFLYRVGGDVVVLGMVVSPTTVRR
jgi:hypothetical protein